MTLSRQAIAQRLLIIGNSGSGKITLAACIMPRSQRSVLDLDAVHWRADGRKREELLARQTVAALAAEPRWIIEGVYGWLAEVAVARATALIWTDLPWSECQDGLLRRGLRRGMTETDRTALVAWAAAYWTRRTPSSWAGHLRLFEDFPGEKARLSMRLAVDLFVASLSGGPEPVVD